MKEQNNSSINQIFSFDYIIQLVNLYKNYDDWSNQEKIDDIVEGELNRIENEWIRLNKIEKSKIEVEQFKTENERLKIEN